jgi:hypothetical protein
MKQLVSIVVALVAFAAIGSAQAANQPGPNGNGPPNKVTVCHNGVTQEVNSNAVAALVAQGATLGACPEVTTPPGPENEPPACDLGNEAVNEQNPNCESEEDTGGDTTVTTDTTVVNTGSSSSAAAHTGGSARKLFCLNGQMIDLPVTQALVGPYADAVAANFYAGVGASCDALSGYVATGLWVDPSGTLTIPAGLVDLPWVVAYRFYAQA